MSFWKSLFGQTVPNKSEYLAAMVEMASEAERTYRGMLAHYNKHIAPSDVNAATPTGRGIYKARLFGALFLAIAYARSGPSPEDGEEMMRMATGLALEPLQGQGDVRLSRDEAMTFEMSHLRTVVRSMAAAFDAGPCEPLAPKPEHYALTEHLHEALEESIGKSRYTSKVKDRFSSSVMGNVTLAMNHARRWIRS